MMSELKRIDKSDVDEIFDCLESTKYIWYDGDNKIMTVIIDKWYDGWIGCHDLEVFPDYRGKGHGHYLVEFIKSKGVTHLSVDPTNEIAISLYEKHGFKKTNEKEFDKLLRMELIND